MLLIFGHLGFWPTWHGHKSRCRGDIATILAFIHAAYSQASEKIGLPFFVHWSAKSQACQVGFWAQFWPKIMTGPFCMQVEVELEVEDDIRVQHVSIGQKIAIHD